MSKSLPKPPPVMAMGSGERGRTTSASSVAAAAAAAVGLADSDFVPYYQRVSISGDDNTGVSSYFLLFYSTN